jgi:tRNA pseudouridine38-40 synthase
VGRFKVYLEYDGGKYSGWQKQKNVKTVQGTIIKALEEIFGREGFDLQGSGRTDSGVHALMQVAHLEVKTMLAPEIIRMKMNDLLPSDINVLEVEKANVKFHARHDAEKRSYLYQISRRRTSFGKNHVWWVKDKLDVGKMKEVSKLFEGMHDFVSFTDDDKEEKSTKVLVEELRIEEIGDLLLIRIVGSHFLWKMVRRITGVLVEVGRGKMKREDIVFFLNNKSNVPAKYTAPPSGLFLEQVVYKGEELKSTISPLINITAHGRRG